LADAGLRGRTWGGVAALVAINSFRDNVSGAITAEARNLLGADIEVNHKTTQAWIGDRVVATAGGDVTVDATSRESLLSISVGAAGGGAAGVAVNAAVSVIEITTRAYIGADAVVDADGTVRVAADEKLKLDIIAGNFAAGGSAGVGAAASVPIVTKTTIAFIGDRASVTGRGYGAGLSVKSGSYEVTTLDIRFDATDSHVDAFTLELGYEHGFGPDQEVIYDNGGGTSISMRGYPTSATGATGVAQAAPVGGDRAQIDRFLRVNDFDPASPEDMARLDDLRDQAVEYLERHLDFRIPIEVAEDVPARDLLLPRLMSGEIAV
jgi:hypothetical protein